MIQKTKCTKVRNTVTVLAGGLDLHVERSGGLGWGRRKERFSWSRWYVKGDPRIEKEKTQ